MLQLFIPGVPRNANASGHWGSGKWQAVKERAKFRSLAAEIARPLAEGREPWPLTRITARHVANQRRRRDPLGLAERLKGIVDGLVDANLIPDDDEKHIEIVLAPAIVDKAAHRGIQLTLEPAQETPL